MEIPIGARMPLPYTKMHLDLGDEKLTGTASYLSR